MESIAEEKVKQAESEAEVRFVVQQIVPMILSLLVPSKQAGKRINDIDLVHQYHH
jgi:hypothetical protein